MKFKMSSALGLVLIVGLARGQSGREVVNPYPSIYLSQTVTVDGEKMQLLAQENRYGVPKYSRFCSRKEREGFYTFYKKALGEPKVYRFLDGRCFLVPLKTFLEKDLVDLANKNAEAISDALGFTFLVNKNKAIYFPSEPIVGLLDPTIRLYIYRKVSEKRYFLYFLMEDSERRNMGGSFTQASQDKLRQILRSIHE